MTKLTGTFHNRENAHKVPNIHADRQTDGQTDRQAGRQTDRQMDRQAGRQADRQTDGQTGRQAGRQAGRQTGRQTDREAGRQRDMTKLTGTFHNRENAHKEVYKVLHQHTTLHTHQHEVT